MLDQASKIFVAGHKGMVGSAIVRQLQAAGFEHIITRNKDELDLTNQAQVQNFFSSQKPDAVILAAAKVGGIHANNTYPAQFIYENLMIQNNVIDSAHKADVQHLLFLGSSCIYPKLAQQPMQESALLSGALEPTNEPYAIAKIAGIKMCESYNRQYGRDYRSVMPTNLYGPNDNFHPDNSHVIPAMMRRFHQAKIANDKKVLVWGSGRPKREFLHVDDMAGASLFVLQLPRVEYEANTQTMLSHINVGTGVDCSISELAQTMCDVVGFSGQLEFDVSKPDGAPRKLMSVGRLTAMGWRSQIELSRGLAQTYSWFLEHEDRLRQA